MVDACIFNGSLMGFNGEYFLIFLTTHIWTYLSPTWNI